MTGLAIKLFLGGLLKRLLSAFRWLVEHPWQAALIVAVVASLWLWRGKQHALAERDLAREEIAALITASKANAAALEKQRRDEQARLDAATKESEHARKQMDAPAYAGLARYITDRRKVSPGPDQRAATTIAESESPELREGVSSSDVLVSETDLRICTARTLDYLALRDWALALRD